MKKAILIFLTIIIITILQKALAGYGTNSFFVTLDAGRGVTPERMADARSNTECQATEKDPKGNWGTNYDGYQLSIRFDKDLFLTNEPVIATLIYRNAGTNYLMHGIFFGGDLDFQVIIKDQTGKELPDTFAPQRTTAHSSQWCPGTQYKYFSNLTRRYGLSLPGTYSISVHRKERKIDGNGIINVYSGVATISIVSQKK